MAEDIDMKDLDRERETQRANEGGGGEETNLDDNRPDDESILVIDGSNPDFTRVGDDEPSTSEIPDARRDAGNMKRDITYDKKKALKEELGITINKGDGPNSTLIYDNLRFKPNEKSGKVTGATYDGKEILVLKNGKLDYSKRTGTSFINKFKELLRKAEADHQKTPAPIAEKRAGIDLPQNVIDSIVENVKERLNIEVNRIAEEISSGTTIDANELRELGGYLFDKDDMIVDGVDLREERLKHFETIEIPFIEEKANKARAEGKERKAALYDAIID